MSSDNYSFREATIDDLPLILNWTEYLMEHEALDRSIELKLNPNISKLLEDWLEKLISDNNSLLIIAMDMSKSPPQAIGLIIGYLQLQPNNFTIFNMHGVIQMVWVEEEYRQKKIASRLVTYMEDTFRNLNIPYCEVQYSDTNSNASHFWDKTGYQKISHSCRKMLE